MQLATANIRSSNYSLVDTNVKCEHCCRSARVFAIALPPHHESRIDGRWQHVEANAFIFYIVELPGPVRRRLLQLSPFFSRKWGEGERSPYWANHCEHCGSMFSDDALHCEPGAFMPSQPAEAQGVYLSHVAEAFTAIAAGHAVDPEFFSLIRRR